MGSLVGELDPGVRQDVADGMTGDASRVSIEERLASVGLPPLPRLTWLEVDLAVLASNARCLRDLLPAGTALGVVVKADGYGHGLGAAARAALQGGADVLIVATLDEAMVLRDEGIGGRILVLYPVPPATLEAALEADLDLVAADEASISALTAVLRRRFTRPTEPRTTDARIHLAIDTGMGRGGVAPERAAEAARRLLGAGLDRIAGTWSHLATPEDGASVAAQVASFEQALGVLQSAGIDPGTRHLDASGGLLSGSGPTYDLVRVGLAFYGVLPPELAVAAEMRPAVGRLRPALSLRGRAATVAEIPVGSQVGYGGTWTASRPSVVATVALGYADGWARAYGEGCWGLVRGRRVPVIGRVSSDALALDVTDVAGFTGADEIVLLGDGPAMTPHDLAAVRGSIVWEVLDALGPRLARVYTRGATPIGIRHLDGRTRYASHAGITDPHALLSTDLPDGPARTCQQPYSRLDSLRHATGQASNPGQWIAGKATGR